ncbi:hypothetical protein GCM10022419_121470 [Nonomuraea rosea]|uniref:DNA-binding protein n=2 Tax=Nonomuraea rosea TaxID=638574 RepID=A0ABP6ZP46_9ACTN
MKEMKGQCVPSAQDVDLQKATESQAVMEGEAAAGQPMVVGLVGAGRLLGMGRTKAYRMAKTGQFPCPVLRIGGRYVVPLRGIQVLLGYHDRDERQERETEG